MSDNLIRILNEVQKQRSNLFYTDPRRLGKDFLTEKDIQEKFAANMWLNNVVKLKLCNIWLKKQRNGCRCYS